MLGIGIRKIVSGGQTGVDLAAIDAAIKHGIAYGGWCPKGRLNETGRIDDKYDYLKEVLGDFSTDDDNYAARTKQNVIDSDGTLIVVPEWPLPGHIKDGTLLTINAVLANNRPFLIIDLSKAQYENAQSIAEWTRKGGIQTLNVAGPRQSSSPGIYELTTTLLNDALSYINKPD